MNTSKIHGSEFPWENLRLPPFPQIAFNVLRVANDESASLNQIDWLISADVAFATEVLTIANSYMYASRFPVTSILHAITRLGSNRLRGICMTVGVRAYLGTLLHRASMQGVWRHDVACALIAEQFASTSRLDCDAAYTAGILHDVGRFALAVVNLSAYENLLQSHVGSADSILREERQLFGADHCQMGRRLVAEWHLPGEFDGVVAEHHSLRNEDGSWTVAELIKVSCRLADALGFSAFQGCEAAPFQETLDRIPYHEQRRFSLSLDELRLHVERNINALLST